MNDGKIILSEKQFDITLKRLSHELIENYDDFSNSCIVGIQERGALLADKIVEILRNEMGINVEYGKLDISFHRDDYRRREFPIAPSETTIDFLIENKRVILIDDVLYTGRTVHAAMTALQQFGRPGQVELLVFVDRRFNRHLPIKADFVGITVDAIEDAYVKVEWSPQDGKNQIKFFRKKLKS